MSARVLLVEDNQSDRLAFERFVVEQQLSYNVRLASSVVEARQLLSTEEFDVVVTDFKLGDGTAIDLLGMNFDIRAVITASVGNEEVAVRAMKAGAHDFVMKDSTGNYLKLLPITIERAIKSKKTDERCKLLRERESEEAVIMGGAALSETLKTIDLAAVTTTPVFITGETGTGKNLVAKAIHFRGPLRAAPFVSVNCAAIPENLVEGELFGYEKGAYTGAVTSKRGLLELAEGGTLLLDELGEMPMHIQSKLLGVLDDRRVRRLGSESTRCVDVRVIAATSINVETALGKSLRSDLFYRLSVIRIALKPLRERCADIPVLCQHFLKRLTGDSNVELAAAEIARLQEYAWPGNVRELRNILERALILHRGSEIRPSLLLGDAQAQTTLAQSPPQAAAPVKTLVDVEREHIARTFDCLHGNITRSAKALGISISTLKRKIRFHRLA
ncbi:MAG: sigma-54-dependent Fis family transcriptional regulator [Deltaproteobacteria bacterium]|nr:sigma-54-dependent Fis family transcriptional regulator [Deltaproteobacteria bacterium]